MSLVIMIRIIPIAHTGVKVLLEAVPSGIFVDDVRQDIETVPGVIRAHHLHITQLDETTSCGSVHVEVENLRSREWMKVVLRIRRVFHDYGIGSTAIQPYSRYDDALADL